MVNKNSLVYELKEGNSIKLLVKEEYGDNVLTFAGKFLGYEEETNEGKPMYIKLAGFHIGEFKLKIERIRINRIQDIARTRLTGKSGDAVNKYFQKANECYKKKLAYDKLMKEARENELKFKNKIDSISEKESKLIAEDNYDELAGSEKVKEFLDKITAKKGERIRLGSGSLVYISKYGDVLRFRFDSLDDDKRFSRSDLKWHYIDTENDGTLYIGEIEENRGLDEVKRLWFSPKEVSPNVLKKYKVSCRLSGNVYEHKGSPYLEVMYNFDFSKSKLSKEDAKKISDRNL